MLLSLKYSSVSFNDSYCWYQVSTKDKKKKYFLIKIDVI